METSSTEPGKKRVSLPRPRTSVGKALLFLAGAVGGGFALGSNGPAILRWTFQLARQDLELERAASSLQSYLLMSLSGVLLGLAGTAFLIRWFEQTRQRWDKLDSGDKVTLFLGVFAGIVVSLLFLQLFNAVGVPSGLLPFLILAVTAGISALCIFALRTMEDVLPWARGKAKTRRTGIKILDTNVIIDGRIYDVARSGFLDGQLYVPGFVLDELQKLSDNHDPLKRQRGRRGLDILRHMQAEFPLQLREHDRFAPPASDDVDGRLVRLAKALGGDIVTNDWNLNRVAGLQEVKVLNLNDLALSLRPNVLPGENLEIAILREGQQYGQGVGYLDDGTMVVVHNGRAHLGETMEVQVTQVIQTERGKMIFAEVPGEEEERERRRGGRRV